MKNERTGYLLANALLLIAALLIALAMNGCMTYKKAVRKFGHLAKDSVTITDTVPVVIADTVYIPGDTVSVTVDTDTTDLVKVVEGKRAKLTFTRTKSFTRLTAEAKPDTLIRRITKTITIRTKCPPVATFGIAPWYKTAFFIALGLLAAMVIAYIFTHKYQVKVAKR